MNHDRWHGCSCHSFTVFMVHLGALWPLQDSCDKYMLDAVRTNATCRGTSAQKLCEYLGFHQRCRTPANCAAAVPNC